MRKIYYLIFSLLLLLQTSVPWFEAKAADTTPVITAQPAALTTFYSLESLSLSVTGASVSANHITFQWQKKDASGNFVDIPGATGSSYSVTVGTASDVGFYQCLLKNGAEPSGIATNTAEVVLKSDEAPKFTKNLPASLTVAEGGNLNTMSITVTGGGTFSYVWKKSTDNGVTYSAITNFTLTNNWVSKVTINPGLYSDNGSYFICEVTNKDGNGNVVGTSTSTPCKLTVTPSAAIPTATIKDKIQLAGTTFNWSITTTSGPTSFQWQKFDGNDFVNIPGATTNLLAITNASASNAGRYRVKVSNSKGEVTSVNGNDPTLFEADLSIVTSVPPAQIIVENTTLTLSAAVAPGTPSSSTNLSYQWYNGPTGGTLITGATSASYTKTGVTVADAGTYKLIITTRDPTLTTRYISTGISVTVNPAAPIIATHPQDQSIKENESISLSIIATGVTGYQWKKDGIDIPGATSATYTKSNTSKTDAGSYTCVVTNAGGSTSSNAAVVTVSVLPPVISDQPHDQAIVEHTPLTLTITATGTDLTYQWKKDGADIQGATLASYTNANTAMTDAGNYTCVVSNAGGTVTSGAAVITVSTSDLMPAVTADPQDQSVTENTSFTLSVAATGTNLLYQWKKDDSAIDGATSAVYKKLNAVTGDAGKYLCVISNSKGAVNSALATVTINLAKPVITTQPTDQTVIEKTPLTLIIAATGTAVKYQWKKNGVDIAGATLTSYTNPSPVMNTDNGDYTCLVSNTGGSVLSTIAKVVISTSDIAPKITAQPTDKTVIENDSLALSVTATGTPLNYQWKKGDKDIAGATSAIYMIKKVALTDSGVYKCVISNLSGTVTSLPVTVAINKAEVLYIPLFDALADEYQQKTTDKVELKVKGPGSELLTNWFIDGTAVTAVEKKFYLELSIAAGNHIIKAETADGKFNIEKPVVIKKTN